MKNRWKKGNTRFCAALMIALLVVMHSSDAHAQFMFSSDIPFETDDGSMAEEKDILYFEPGFFAFHLDGSALGISDGVNIDAFAVSPEGDMLSFDIPAEIDGISYTERDIILHNGGIMSKMIDGAAIGIPAGVDIDAVTRLQDGSILFSVDVPTTLGNISCNPNDIIQYREGVFNLFLNGTAAGIPENANIDAIWVGVSTELLFSLDIPAELNGLAVKETDVIQWTEGNFHLYSGTVTELLPEGADVDGLRLIADHDTDGVFDDEDNCPIIPNGPALGTCMPGSDNAGAVCSSDADCAAGCSSNGQCSKNQEDDDGDGAGDVCDLCAHITAPNGNESWNRNSLRNIRWNAEGCDGTLNLTLWQNNGLIGTIADGVNPAAGSYAWKVGAYNGGVAPLGTGYTIKVKDNGSVLSDESDAPFSIVKISVKTPNGGENWQIGTTQDITWVTKFISSNLRIVLFKNGVKVGNIVNSIDPSLGAYSWTVGQYQGGTELPGTGYLIQVREIGTDAGDRSDAVFTLIP
jgi:hypothetical protein